jgi:hypothetical protein
MTYCWITLFLLRMNNNIYFNGNVDVISNIKKVDKGSITDLDNGCSSRNI